ncbi:MAG: hypothetical protein RJB38_2462 [Pseudomonadota bacterium]|jgi:hypothetical protein
MKPTQLNHGFSMIEAIIGMLLLGVAGVGTFQVVNQLSSQITHNVDQSDKSKVVNQLIETIQENLMRFKVNYTPSDDATSAAALDSSQLPFGFANGAIIDGKDCGTQCVGKFGIVINPKSGYRGLYVVRVRVKLENIPNPFDYQLLVTDR